MTLHAGGEGSRGALAQEGDVPQNHLGPQSDAQAPGCGNIHTARAIGRVKSTQPSKSRLPAAPRMTMRTKMLRPGPPTDAMIPFAGQFTLNHQLLQFLAEPNSHQFWNSVASNNSAPKILGLTNRITLHRLAHSKPVT